MSANTKDRSSRRSASVRRRLAQALAAMACAVLGLVATAPPARTQAPPSPPPQPAVGELGGEGPCAVPASHGTAGPQVSVDTNLRT